MITNNLLQDCWWTILVKNHHPSKSNTHNACTMPIDFKQRWNLDLIQHIYVLANVKYMYVQERQKDESTSARLFLNFFDKLLLPNKEKLQSETSSMPWISVNFSQPSASNVSKLEGSSEIDRRSVQSSTSKLSSFESPLMPEGSDLSLEHWFKFKETSLFNRQIDSCTSTNLSQSSSINSSKHGSPSKFGVLVNLE